MTLSPRRNLFFKTTSAPRTPNNKPGWDGSRQKVGRNAHLADEPVLVYRASLLAVGHGRLGPHLLLFAGGRSTSVSFQPPDAGRKTYHILENHVAMPVKRLYAREPAYEEHVSWCASFHLFSEMDGRERTYSLRLERMLIRTWAWLRTAVWRMDSGPLAISQFSCVGGLGAVSCAWGEGRGDVRVVQSHIRWLVAKEKLARVLGLLGGGGVMGGMVLGGLRVRGAVADHPPPRGKLFSPDMLYPVR